MSRPVLGLVLLAAGCLVGGQAAAGVIHHNGTPDEEDAYFSDFDFPQQVADDFVLGAANVIRDIHWWGAYAFENTPPDEDDWTVRVFELEGGLPKVTPLVELPLGHLGRTPTDQYVASGQYRIYEYAATVPDIALSSGTTYFLSIVNNTEADIGDDWGWATSADLQGSAAWRYVDGEGWMPFTAEMAFYLTDDRPDIIPEPATLCLLGLGGLGLLIRRRRRH